MLVYAGRSAKRAQLSSSSSRSERILVRIDLRRHARRIVLQPDLVPHLIPPTDRHCCSTVTSCSTLAQRRPEIVEQSRLRRAVRMDAVGLHQLLVQRDAVQKEVDQRRVVSVRASSP